MLILADDVEERTIDDDIRRREFDHGTLGGEDEAGGRCRLRALLRDLRSTVLLLLSE